ncbi:hypothetical protein WJ968_11965 [Achromobacter xylosoxidans]
MPSGYRHRLPAVRRRRLHHRPGAGRGWGRQPGRTHLSLCRPWHEKRAPWVRVFHGRSADDGASTVPWRALAPRRS